jgi:tetratricopeptide (TPR) repeat protein
MKHSRTNKSSKFASADLDSALAAMSVDELRESLREGLELLSDVNERAHGRAVDSLLHRAARESSDGSSSALSDAQVAEVLDFARVVKRKGHAEPEDVDDYLRLGSAAFRRKDYAAAHQIFGALLPPISNGDLYLGEEEMVEEVLCINPAECGVQYVVATYMIAPEAKRADAVFAAIDEVQSLGDFREPLHEMERVTIEPLPEFEAFLRQWRTLIASKLAARTNASWSSGEEHWLREVVLRLEGIDGLARLARSTRQNDDLLAWCARLVEAGDWAVALPAFEEAAELVADRGSFIQGKFLDGAALAAQILGHVDLAERLERAWRAVPSMARLRRWLGSSDKRETLSERISQAFAVCPTNALSQRALLHLLSYDFEAAAHLLTEADGLAWSDEEHHPGRLLFSIFERLLSGRGHERGTEKREATETAEKDRPRLATPKIDQLLELAGIDVIPEADVKTRTLILEAMKQTAQKRIASVTAEKRRDRYEHAAKLVASCVACDATGESARWATTLRDSYRRFYALRDCIDRAMGVRSKKG